ncbi:hypothetical protein OJ997_20030 [Solirubrobacter phytolaccae]|uniref:Uncharacterized protein n=1 Tax=Solirubrobacter phytolaccae TaxID=1404360 RepID=A0A9X3NCX7_9ACTN|nr:hypothetical protein [Solirubrobacter phytolaccae]MDA0182610.1 hypothetical protein [Solirubrobacter phytolaccae]
MQWEWPGRLGPPPGRYVVRRYAGDDAQAVVVISEGTAPRRVGRREPRDTVPVTRVTVIDADPLFDDATASEWLRSAGLPSFGPETLNRLVRSFRVASADPYLADLDLSRAWRTRVGYGSGEQVADGEWTEARELDAPTPRQRGSKRSKHRPTDRLAALLSGRDAILACEDLTLRARQDLDLGRVRETALQLEAALITALAELAGWREQGDMSQRLVELDGLRETVAQAAASAREGTLEATALEGLSDALERLEAALRARAIYAAEGG